MTLTNIAEQYLTLLQPGDPNADHYVRLAAKYGVPTGRIILLSRLPAEVVIGYLEERT